MRAQDLDEAKRAHERLLRARECEALLAETQKVLQRSPKSNENFKMWVEIFGLRNECFEGKPTKTEVSINDPELMSKILALIEVHCESKLVSLGVKVEPKNQSKKEG
jgi:hypothetical protein